MSNLVDFLLNQLLLAAFAATMLGYPAYLYFGG